MKLLLTSAGFENKKVGEIFIYEIEKNPVEVKVLIVASARTPEENFYVGESQKELEQCGIKDISVYNLDRDIVFDELKQYDVVYVCGGNTFFIYSQMKKFGFDVAIVEYIKTGGFYIGVSAGSVIPGPSIEIAGWGANGDKNDIGLKDLTGLKIVDFAISPHFKEEERDEIGEFQSMVNYKVETLMDDQAILVKDSKIEKIN